MSFCIYRFNAIYLIIFDIYLIIYWIAMNKIRYQDNSNSKFMNKGVIRRYIYYIYILLEFSKLLI
jgi:hypothetical protein